MRIVIIGGVAAGMSAAAKARRTDKEADIVVYEKGGYLSYGACGLPYYVSGRAEKKEDLLVRSPEEFSQRGIENHLYHEVVNVIPSRKTVVVKNVKTGDRFEDTYDKLMVATGASAIIPPIEGVDLGNISPLKTLEDGLDMRPLMEDETIQKVTVVGGGYIGMEVAETLTKKGKKVRIIELADKILMPFDQEISDYAHHALEDKGVDIHIGEKVTGFKGDQTVTKVLTDQGEYETDYVVMSVGIRPNTGFLKDSGIDLAENGAVLVDQEMRTSLEDIYSAGDCATVYHYQKKENTYLPLGTMANKCGKLAGINLCGGHEKYVGALGSAAVKILDYDLARTGLSEQEARDQGLDYKVKTITTHNRPKYYPPTHDIIFKVVYEAKTKELLGVQAVGKGDVVQRVNMYAVAIHNKMKASDFGMIDFCYAPPFSGAWDAAAIPANVIK